MQSQPIDTYYANHKGQAGILLGNGPSLELLRPYREYLNRSGVVQIGMNQSWRLWPTLHHCVMFHFEHLQDIQEQKWPIQGSFIWAYKGHCEEYLDKVKAGNVIYIDDSIFRTQGDLRDTQISGLISIQLDEGSSADMTGHFALEVALWLGCNPIYLIGYDCYGAHFCDSNKPEEDYQEVQADLFDQTAIQLKLEKPEIKIVNLNPDSLIREFEKKTLEEVFGETTKE